MTNSNVNKYSKVTNLIIDLSKIFNHYTVDEIYTVLLYHLFILEKHYELSLEDRNNCLNINVKNIDSFFNYLEQKKVEVKNEKISL